MTARTLKLFLQQKQGLTWTQADKEASCSCSKHCCSTWERTAGGHLNRRSVSKTSAWGKAVGGTRQSVLWIGKQKRGQKKEVEPRKQKEKAKEEKLHQLHGV